MIVWRESLADVPREGAVVLVASLKARGPFDETGPRAIRLALAQRLIAARLGVAPETVVISHEASGAPIVAAPDASLHISISGRDDFCAIAVADHPMGVDIEPIGAPIEPPWNILHDDERHALLELDEAARHIAFLRLWTAKETYLKALGAGLSMEPASLEIRPFTDDRFAVHPLVPPVIASAAKQSRLGAGSGLLRCARNDAHLGEWRALALDGRAFIAAGVTLSARTEPSER